MATVMKPKVGDAFKFLSYVVSRGDSKFLRPQLMYEGGRFVAVVVLKNGYVIYDLSKKFDVDGDNFYGSVLSHKHFKVLEGFRDGVLEFSGGRLVFRGERCEYVIPLDVYETRTNFEEIDFEGGVSVDEIDKYGKYISWLDFRNLYYTGLQNFYFFADGNVVITNAYVMLVIPSGVNMDIVVPFDVKDLVYGSGVRLKRIDESRLAFSGDGFRGVVQVEVNNRIADVYNSFRKVDFKYYSFEMPVLPSYRRDDRVYLGILKDGVLVVEGDEYDYKLVIDGLKLDDDIYFSTELNWLIRHLSGRSLIFGVDYLGKSCLISIDGITAYSVLRRKI